LQGPQPIQGAIHHGKTETRLIHDIAGVLSDP
jgi:hypothetical protein